MEFKTLISLHLPVSWRAQLEDMALRENVATLKRVTMSDLIRRALKGTYNFDAADNKGEGLDVESGGQ